MHIITKDIQHASGKTFPHFWSVSSSCYQMQFSAYEHAYGSLEMATLNCPPDGTIISELSRHQGGKQTLEMYQKRFPLATNIICLRRGAYWVVYGKLA